MNHLHIDGKEDLKFELGFQVELNNHCIDPHLRLSPVERNTLVLQALIEHHLLLLSMYALQDMKQSSLVHDVLNQMKVADV